jgi:predicted small secreted protein
MIIFLNFNYRQTEENHPKGTYIPTWNKTYPQGFDYMSDSKMEMKGSVMLKSIISIMLLMFLSVSLAACNTVEGAGEDIGSAGDAIEDAAK